jgi:prepilin-type N-terminal cleavage/methylation domain-containing protein
MLKRNQKGFTLIELMIVIAIIGILAAIAIPNFIDYRNKSFCSRTESDANNIAAALADYFSIPSHTAVPTGSPVTSLRVQMTGTNTGDVSGTATAIRIQVTDGSGRCPTTYRSSTGMVGNATSADGWIGTVYNKHLRN